MSRNGTKRDTKPDKRTPETIDGSTGKPEGTPQATGANGEKPQCRIDLSTLRDCRLEMAYVYREMDAGKMDNFDGTKRVWVLRQIADVITIGELEKRLQDLEERQAGGALQAQRQLPARTLN